jgi:hypothetical protein
LDAASAVVAGIGPNPTPAQIQAAVAAGVMEAQEQPLTAGQLESALDNLFAAMGPNPTAEGIAAANLAAMGRNLTQGETAEAVAEGVGEALDGQFADDGGLSLPDAAGPSQTPGERLSGIWDGVLDDERMETLTEAVDSVGGLVLDTFTGPAEGNVYFDFSLPWVDGGDRDYRFYFTPSNDSPMGVAVNAGRLLFRTFLMFVLTIKFYKRLVLVFENNG